MSCPCGGDSRGGEGCTCGDDELWMTPLGAQTPDKRGTWRRLRVAWHALRGHPVIYRVMLDPRGAVFPNGSKFCVVSCMFAGNTSVIVYDPITGQAEALDLAKIQSEGGFIS